MRSFDFLTRAIFIVIGGTLILLALGLVVFAVVQLFPAATGQGPDIGVTFLTSIGYMIIAVAVFEVAKYILEEEVLDPTEMRHTGEARRSLTKFLSTIAIAVFLEALVAIFQSGKDAEALDQMLYPTLLLLAGVALIVALGVYQRLSALAEKEIRSSPTADAEERESLRKE